MKDFFLAMPLPNAWGGPSRSAKSSSKSLPAIVQQMKWDLKGHLMINAMGLVGHPFCTFWGDSEEVWYPLTIQYKCSLSIQLFKFQLHKCSYRRGDTGEAWWWKWQLQHYNEKADQTILKASPTWQKVQFLRERKLETKSVNKLSMVVNLAAIVNADPTQSSDLYFWYLFVNIQIQKT